MSKQTVYKRYKGNLSLVCAPYAHTYAGVLYILEQGETLIKEDFYRSATPIGAPSDSDTVLSPIIQVLQEQLTVKDTLIEQQQHTIQDLTSALLNAQQTAQTAQALHAGTIQTQLSDGRADESTSSRGFFSRIFGRGKQ
jgi:hypothetical protein